MIGNEQPDNNQHWQLIERRLDSLERQVRELRQHIAPGMQNDSMQTEAPSSQPDNTQISRFFDGWERFIGENFLIKLGLLAILLAITWFIKLAIENAWLNASGRLFAAMLLAIGMAIFARHALSKSFYKTAPALVGSALAILYITIFSAYYFYSFLTLTETFFYLVLLCLYLVWLAKFSDSQVIYLFGLLGAILAPVLMSSKQNSYLFLFTYLTAINGINLYLSRYFWWRISSSLLMASNFLIFGLWAQENLGHSNQLIVFAFIMSTYGIFTAREIVAGGLLHRRFDAFSLLALFSIKFFTLFALLHLSYPSYIQPSHIALASLAILCTIEFALFSSLLKHQDPRQHEPANDQVKQAKAYSSVELRLILSFFAMIFYLTYFSAMLQAFWQAHSIILVALASQMHYMLWRRRYSFAVAILFWIMALWQIFVLSDFGSLMLPFINNRFITITLLSGAFSLSANHNFVFGARKTLEPSESKQECENNKKTCFTDRLQTLFFTLSYIVFLIALFWDIHDFVNNVNLRHIFYTLSLTLICLIFLLSGLWLKKSQWRYIGLLSAGLAVGKLYFYDIWMLPLIVRIGAGLILGIALVLAGIFYQKQK